MLCNHFSFYFVDPFDQDALIQNLARHLAPIITLNPSFSVAYISGCTRFSKLRANRILEDITIGVSSTFHPLADIIMNIMRHHVAPHSQLLVL